MAGWGWMSRLAGDAGCQLEAQMGLPSCGFLCWALGSREGGLREGGLLAKSKVAKGARWKRPFETPLEVTVTWLVGATGNLPCFQER